MVSVCLIVLLTVPVISAIPAKPEGDCEWVCKKPDVIPTKPTSDGCNCVIPPNSLFPVADETYNRAWWQKIQDSMMASLGTGSAAPLIPLHLYSSNNGCSLTTSSPHLGVMPPLKNHEYNTIMVTTADKMINVTSPHAVPLQVKFDCNEKGQWTYKGTHIKVAAAINTVITPK